MKKPADYTNSVFINCPFDDDYKPFLNAMAFAVLDCGFTPRSAYELSNSANVRIFGILKIMHECKYSIHDISKADLDKNTKLARFNMPYELGLLSGLYYSGLSCHSDKVIKIFDSHANRYDKFISDISGQDISIHGNKPKLLIDGVRNWLVNSSRRMTIPDSTILWKRYQRFVKHLPIICEQQHKMPASITFLERVTYAQAWLNKNIL